MSIRLVRLLIYECADQEALDSQIGKSIAEGVRSIPQGTIRVVNLPESIIRAFGALARLIEERSNDVSVP